jgi:hypothetical protein
MVQQTDYECFAFTVTTTRAVEHAIEFQPFIDNRQHVHHALLFLYPHINPNTGLVNTPNPDGPYGCLGLVNGADLIGGWFPGRGTDHLPTNVGVPVHDSDQIVLQMHYDSVTMPGIDNSGIRVLLASQAGMIDAGLFWTGYVWSNPLQANAMETRTSTCVLPGDMVLFADIPHMHRHGTHIEFEVQPGGTGPFQTVRDVPGWNFDDQPIYPVLDPVTQQQGWQLHAGDIVRTTCWWQVGADPIAWGEGSGNEMCYNFMYHYPLVSETGSMPNLRSCVRLGP